MLTDLLAELVIMLLYLLLHSAARSWSFRALGGIKLTAGPIHTYICNIDFILVMFLSLSSLLRDVYI